MKEFHDALVRRRVALVERSSAQRKQVADAATDLRRAAATPLLLGVGVAATLLSSSPRLRGWVVRAWAAYSLIRRLLDR